MITHLHVKDDSLNRIAVIGRTIFVENWLWRPFCLSEIAENQYLICVKKIGDDIYISLCLDYRTR